MAISSEIGVGDAAATDQRPVVDLAMPTLRFDMARWVIEVRRRHFVFRFESSEHFLRVFKDFYGPIIKALEAQTPERRVELEVALTELLDSSNVATDGTLCIPSEYLEIVITKKA